MIECEICQDGTLASRTVQWVDLAGPVFVFKVCARHAAEALNNGAQAKRLEDVE